MNINRTEIEVRYQETDQMGVVYHANYLVWFEIGRTKFIEQLGFKYAEMEEQNLLSPVINAQLTYKKPVRYGEKVMIETWLKMYDGIRTIYGYKILNSINDVAVSGTTEHVVVQKDTFQPVRLRKVYPAWDIAFKKLKENQ